MRIARAVVIFASGVLGACRSAASSRTSPCDDPTVPIPRGVHNIRLSHAVDPAYARLGLARLVFRVRSSGPNNLGAPIAATVVLRDSVAAQATPFGRLGDSTGIVVLDSVPMRYVGARVSRLGYAVHILPLDVRPGYADTIDVALPEVRVCLYH